MRKRMLLVIVIAFYCCKDIKEKPDNILVEDENATNVSSYLKVGDELLKNVKFNNWDTNAKPTNWEINENILNPDEYVVDRDTLDLMLKGSVEQEIFIKQTVNVEPNEFYVLEVLIETNVKHNSNSGILVTTQENEVLAKRIFDSKNQKTYKVLFDSGAYKTIQCYIGFIDNEKGEIKIKSLTLSKVKNNTNYYNSEIAQLFDLELLQEINDEKSFNEGVSQIIRHASDILLAKKRNDSSLIAKGNLLLKVLKEDSFFSKYITTSGHNITNSYETKLVYSANDVLDKFNIGTQRIELYKNNNRIHLLLNYYNPYSKKWITIDPFYNSKISLDNLENLSSVKKEQITTIELGGLSNNIDGLIKKYSGTKAILKQEKIMGYPF